MVSAYFKRYKHINHWPDLKMVKEKGSSHPWHIDETAIICIAGSRLSGVTGQRNIFKVWISQSFEKNRLCMLDKSGNEISPEEICDACAGKMMKLLKWSGSDEGSLEIEQQVLKDELEEQDFRAKGLTE